MRTKLTEISERDIKLSLVTHQLKSPISTVLASVSLLKRNESINSKDSYILDIIEKNSFMLLKSAQNVLEVIRIEAGDHSFSPNTYDYIDYVHNLVVTSLPYAKIVDVKLKFKTNIDILHIPFDKYKTTLIIMNLLSNALKFSKAGTTVTVSIISKDGTLSTNVIDGGNGIPKEKVPFIFDKLYTGATSYGTNGEGGGLGLYIAMQNAVELGGTIKYSKAKLGSKLSYIFPYHLTEEYAKLCEQNIGADDFYEQNVRIHLTDVIENKYRSND